MQWDAALNYIDPNYITNASIGTPNCAEDSYVRDSTGKGWYDQDNATNTGYYEVNHIYDLAGNVFEWTMESFITNFRVSRGGVYYNSGTYGPSSYRDNGPPVNAAPSYGFRLTLYL